MEWQTYEKENEESSDEWGTPRKVWKPISDSLNGFDLDPASGAEPVQIATDTYTKKDDGLSQNWYGTVWVNPPYSDPGAWIRKAVDENNKGNTDTIVMLLPARTNTNYFSKYLPNFDYVVFVDHKVEFLQEGEAAGQALPNSLCFLIIGDVNKNLINHMNTQGWVVDVEEQTTKITDFI